MSALQIFKYNQPFTLESGASIPGYHLGYHTFGKLNKEKNNVLWIFHALTANSNPTEWWPGLVGEGKLFNPEEFFIVCVNMPGSCYGSIGPLDIDVRTGQPYYHLFPFFTTRDMIRAYQPLKEFLGIDKIFIGIGGSMGGQQLLEWACEEPDLFDIIIPIATNAFHSPWGIAFNATQRQAIKNDSTWQQSNPKAGIDGMKTARAIALISYRHYDAYERSQSETDNSKLKDYKSESYQKYQGEKLANRFNAFSYYKLSQGMDSHNVGRNRGNVAEVLGKIESNTLVLSITTDILFPVQEQEYIADHILDAEFHAIYSPYGHDGFLIEYDAIEKRIKEFITKRTFFYNHISIANNHGNA